MDRPVPYVAAPNDTADAPLVEALLEAWRAGEMSKVDALLDRCVGQPSVDSTPGLIALQRGRFDDAAALLNAAGDDPVISAAARLAANLAALRVIDPDAAHEVTAANDDHFAIELGRVSLPDETPADLERQWDAVHDSVAQGMSTGVLGVGDGRLMDCLLRNAPSLEFGRQQCVFVIEPDAARLRGLFTAFDFTEALEQSRVQWCLGKRWAETLESTLRDQPYLGPPTLTLTQGLTDAQTATYQQVMDRYRSAFEACCERVDAYYRSLPANHFDQAFAENPSRPPRVLLCTSRFTTVLQHAIADAALGFEQMGYETRVLKEPSDHHRLTAVAYRHVLDDFKPDVVFMIDHLRHEFRGCFPPELPFVCWIQDDLGNLTNPAAGASIGPRDFVLTCAEPLYVNAFGYPAEQCLYLHKLTAVRDTPDRAGFEDAPDIAFVSHGSAIPETIADQLLSEHGDTDDHRRVLDTIRATYDCGEWLATMSRFRRLLTSLDVKVSDAFVLDAFNRLNNVLYRQQALDWVVDYATDHDVTLGLYGHGWDDHPRFAEFARGPVAYGDDLARLTAAAKVNLQLLPFSCLHQRLLDGIAAEGFFLIRAHPLDDATQALRDAIVRHVDPKAKTIDEACRRLDAAAAEELRAAHQQVSEAMGEPAGDDLPTVFGGDDAMRELHQYTALPPHYVDVRFTTATEFHERLDRYLADADARHEIVAEQRRHVVEHKSYRAGLTRVMAQVYARLTGQTPAAVIARHSTPTVPTPPRRPRKAQCSNRQKEAA